MDKKIITLTIKSERMITKIIFDHLLLMYVKIEFLRMDVTADN